MEGKDIINVPLEALIDGLRGTLFATSPDEAKQVLMLAMHAVKDDNDTLNTQHSNLN